MNFDDTPQEAAFRRLARDWIADNAPRHLLPTLEGAGFDKSELRTPEMVAAAKAWQRRKFDGGWACPHWPEAFGGRGASPIERIIWEQEEGPYGDLSGLFVLGHGMCGPTLMACADDAQKARYLPPIASGEEVWCQLFSEPSGGSDLAGLRTQARPDGDDWVIKGQKIWTSYAQHAQFGLLLARTDPSVAKHRGLTMFFLDMRSPGVEVRPIRQATGEAEFNEVFFDEVRIPDNQRLGPVGGGWQVSLTTLMNERLAVATTMPTGLPQLLDLCRSDATSGRPIDDPAVRARLASLAVRASGLKYSALRSISALSNGREPGPENSIGKLVMGQMLEEVAAFALDLQGQKGVLVDRAAAPAAGYFQSMMLRSPAVRIEGGTDEILRNIIAERVLGLPQDIRLDKGMPFNEIPA